MLSNTAIASALTFLTGVADRNEAFGVCDVCSAPLSEVLITLKIPYRCFPVGSYSDPKGVIAFVQIPGQILQSSVNCHRSHCMPRPQFSRYLQRAHHIQAAGGTRENTFFPRQAPRHLTSFCLINATSFIIGILIQEGRNHS